MSGICSCSRQSSPLKTIKKHLLFRHREMMTAMMTVMMMKNEATKKRVKGIRKRERKVADMEAMESTENTAATNIQVKENQRKRKRRKLRKEKHEEEEEEEKKEKREEPHKPENLLTSPQEQSKFIMSSMNNATQESYGAMEKLVKVMDYLHGVVSLLNQIIQLAPPSPTFSETVILESPGKKISLKALLDEAANVRSSVDALFTMLMSAKHSIIGAINRAIPARPPAAAPAAAAAAAAAATTPPPPK
ncbi:uncharacterized protein EMH_0077220 [Eimeria mitis]|uniref:Uncharacterized protein n=1 Tax=Eimeria mitis TaxID=44415 RepID=U6K4R3_9EIME|nr:uncharacterized protein EMH_0077220 [Eimeria mitis]CDJ32725.1 hypothetical protein, conserved [Eimeria mitis]